MINKRLWIALLAIPISLASLLVIGAQKLNPANAGGVIDPTCTSSLPCIEYDNNGSGPGIRGISVGGNGLAGATKFNSTTATNAREGLIGNDISTSGSFNAGVRGLSVRGFGVAGQSTSGTGVLGTSTNGSGVQGTSSTNNAVFGDSQAVGASGVYGQNDGGGFGVAGRVTRIGHEAVFADAGNTGSTALKAQSFNGVGANVIGGYTTFINDRFPALSIINNNLSDLIDACPSGTANPCDGSNSVFRVDEVGGVTTMGGLQAAGEVVAGEFGAQGFNGSDLYFGKDPSGINVFLVDNMGNVHAHSFTSDLVATHIQQTATGQKVQTYSQQSSEPSLEDFGEAQLVNGQAYVRLSPEFANVVDQRSNYLVVVTPEGPSRGLYVTQKTPAGFAVMENPGGHSALAFGYRIVAKPFGSRDVRLPMVELPKFHSGLPTQPRRFHSQP